MTNIRPFTLKNKYFSDDKEKLQQEIQNLIMSVPRDYDVTTRLAIVPHAAYKYSGKTAVNALQYLKKGLETVFIFAPAHYIVFFGAALSCYDAWETPLGVVEIDRSFNRELMSKFDIDCDDRIFEHEHGVDVQVPLLQTMLPGAKIVPVSYGKSNFRKIAGIMDNYFPDERLGFVLVSDFAHLSCPADAQKMDDIAAAEVERKAIAESLQCKIETGGKTAPETHYSVIRTEISFPEEKNDLKKDSQGYGSWIVVEDSIPAFFKREFSDTILDICRNSIISGLEYGFSLNVDEIKLAAIFDTYMASYVSVFIDGKLRGRAGDAFPFEPLKNNLAKNAYNAAFKTKTPVNSDEIDKMSLDVCLLARPQMIPFSGVDDLCEKIDENAGLVIKNDKTEAVFLPCMWQDYPEKKEFLNALFKEAGFQEIPSASAFGAYQFKVVTISG